MNQQGRAKDKKRLFPLHQHRQDQHIGEVEALANKENHVFPQRMPGALQVIVGGQKKMLEVSNEYIIKREHRVNQQRIDVLEAVERGSRFMRRKAKNAASGRRV